jgi:lipoate-protein ligase A
MQENSGPKNMALDDAVSESVRAQTCLPTIRFYSWNPSCVTVGYHQGLLEEVNVLECEKRGFDVVRRITGGGAVYHDRQGEITYSVIGPQELFPAGIIDSYKLVCGWIVDGLQTLGIQAAFAPINDIVVGGKKISGNAQTRRGGVLQQHGTILYELDVPTMFSVLKVSKEKLSDKLVKRVEERVTCISRGCAASREQAYLALLESFTRGKKIEYGDFTMREIERAQELAKNKYSSHEWNYQR